MEALIEGYIDMNILVRIASEGHILNISEYIGIYQIYRVFLFNWYPP